ncbi:MAG: hypothetical protein MUF00_06460 [Gemmatimonadaceae bacterium]|jgi:hypothetical protein|nr:hypothetical protein [Gemmatimonadaceae bacterium]
MAGLFAMAGLIAQDGWAVKDQYGRLHTEATLRGRAVVLLVARSKAGGEQLQLWTARLRERTGTCADSIAIVRAADLSFIPRLLRGQARKRLPLRDSLPVLLDFERVLATRYRLSDSTTTQVVLDRQGSEIARFTGMEATPLAVSRVADAVCAVGR